MPATEVFLLVAWQELSFSEARRTLSVREGTGGVEGGVDMMAKSAADLPFLEEKLAFRRAVPLPSGSRVLCGYAGRAAKLTGDYVRRGASVIAVDLEPVQEVAAEWVRGRIPEALPCEGEFEVVDLDPDGSPMPALADWLACFRGSFRWLVLTDGAMSSARYRRRMNLWRHYSVLPDATERLPGWCWRQFECLVFHRVVSLVRRSLLEVRFARNRYQMGLYAAFCFADA